MTGNPRRDRLLIIYLCFFVSGFAGLVYEILWNKYLALFIGSTGRAHVMTLAVFMGGLALGSAVFGRRADRVRNPLLLYIVLEMGVGLCGLAYPFLFEPYRKGFIAVVRALGLTSGALMTAKLVFCALTILVPTFLMGGTLPVLGRYLVNRLEDLGPRVATLYYINTFGAFVGCLQAGFIMISTYGLRWAMMIAAGLNFAVCILASLLMQKKYREVGQMEDLSGVKSGQAASLSYQADSLLYSRAMRTAVLVTIGISGFAAMVYEIAWIRLLTLVLGASTYSFSLMVATFIFGIGLGSFLLSFKRRESGYDVIYGWAELGLGLCVLAMLPLIERVPFWFNQLSTLFTRASFAFGPYMFVQMLICFLLMLAPTVLLGMTLPAASRVATEHVGRVGSRVGTVYALNTVGTLLGAATGGLLLLPHIGLKHTLEVGIVLNLLSGLAVIWLLSGQRARAVRGPASFACAGLFFLYLIAVPQWDKNILSSGVYRQRDRFVSYQAMLNTLAKRENLLYYKDGVDASIAVVHRAENRSLLINGKADASDTGDLGTEILISHYPLMSRPNSKQVLVIGMGSGVSIGSALQYPVEHVDAVEISKEVFEAATTYFTEANFHFADDPRVTIHIEDAKTFLQITPTVYDVIISEPTNPWIAGVAGLFSKEFFETCSQHLAPDGMILQWIHVYEIQDAALMSVLRTFTDAFPYFVIWNMNRLDIALLGSRQPFQPHFDWIESQIARPEVARDLKRLGIEHPLALLATQMFTNTTRPTDIFSSAVVNSDLRPYLEYEAPKGFFAGSPAKGVKSLDMRAWPRQTRQLWIDQYRPARVPTSEQFAVFYRSTGATGSLFDDKLRDWSSRWREAYPNDPRAVQAWIESRSEGPQWHREQLNEAIRRFPKDAGLADLRARVLYELLQRSEPDAAVLRKEAREATSHALALHPQSQWPHERLLLTIAYQENQMDEVLRLGPKVFPHLAEIRDEEGKETAFTLLQMVCEAAVARGRRDVAEHCLSEMRVIMPRDLRLFRLQGLVAHMAGQANAPASGNRNE